MNLQRDIGIARQIGKYADAVEVAGSPRGLFTSGTPGLAADGSVPAAIAAQTELAWSHILGMLESAGMSVADIVKVTQYLTVESHIAEYAQVRSRFLGDAPRQCCS